MTNMKRILAVTAVVALAAGCATPGRRTAQGAVLGGVVGAGVGGAAKGTKGAVVGAVAGATIGFVAGGGLSAVEPAARPLSAEQGVTVAVQVPRGDETERAARLLAAVGPMRLDVTDEDGRVVDTVETDAHSVPHEVGRTLARGAEDPRLPADQRGPQAQ